MTSLTTAIVESFNLKKTFKRTDHDDSGFEFELPCGIELMGFTQLNNEPCEIDMLEGLDGFICIETKEQLEELISMSWDQLMDDIKARHPEFDRDEY